MRRRPTPAGSTGSMILTTAVNLRLTRKNLEQQRELEAQRAQGTALQAYYEQIGKLLTEYELLTTDREEIRELARGQTFTVLQEVDGNGKRSLLTFLHGARLITGEGIPPVVLYGADLRESKLRSTNLRRVNLEMVDLREVDLQEADLHAANLRGANLHAARGLTQEQIEWTIGSSETKLPEGLNRPQWWSEDIEQQIKIVQERLRRSHF